MWMRTWYIRKNYVQINSLEVITLHTICKLINGLLSFKKRYYPLVIVPCFIYPLLSNLLLEVPKFPELWSLESSSSSFRSTEHEDSKKGRLMCFCFLFEICPTKTASWRTFKFSQWFLQKLEKGSSEYFSLFHHFQLLSLFPEHTHPPPVIFFLKGATCLRLKKEHSYTNFFTEATKLDFGSLKKILEEP